MTIRTENERLTAEIKIAKEATATLGEKLDSERRLKNKALGELSAIRLQVQQFQKELADLRHELEHELLKNLTLTRDLEVTKNINKGICPPQTSLDNVC